MALVLSTALTLTTGVASAKTAFAASTVVGINPVTAGCDKDAQTLQWNVGAIPGVRGATGMIYLRYSAYCQSVWAKVVLDHPLPSGYEVNAIVTRNYDNQQYDCTTGNLIVTPGEKSCFSGMVWHGSTPPVYPAYAAAMFHVIGQRWIEFMRTNPA